MHWLTRYQNNVAEWNIGSWRTQNQNPYQIDISLAHVISRIGRGLVNVTEWDIGSWCCQLDFLGGQDC